MTPPAKPTETPPIWNSDPLVVAVWLAMLTRAEPLLNGLVRLERWELADEVSPEGGPRCTEADVARALETLRGHGRVGPATGREHRALGYWRVVDVRRYQHESVHANV